MRVADDSGNPVHLTVWGTGSRKVLLSHIGELVGGGVESCLGEGQADTYKNRGELLVLEAVTVPAQRSK